MNQYLVLQGLQLTVTALRLTAANEIHRLGQLHVSECFSFCYVFKKKNHKTTWASFLINDLGFSFLSQTKLANGTSSMIVPKQRKLSASYEKEKELCVKYFEQWSESDQVEFVEHLISQMCHYQHGHINSYLKPMLQRDFITALPGISAGRGSLLFHLVFQKTVPLGFLWLWPALLMRSLQGSACKIDDSFWMKSSIPMQNIGTFCFVFLPSL